MSLASTVAAEEITRRALVDAGVTLATDDALPSRLVEIAQRYDLPPHVIVLWIQQARPQMLSDPGLLRSPLPALPSQRAGARV